MRKLVEVSSTAYKLKLALARSPTQFLKQVPLGEVYFLAKSITPNELRALLTISGGESIKKQDLLDRGILQ